MRPDRLEFGAVRQRLSHLNRRIGGRILPLSDEIAVLQPCDSLPLHDTTFVQSLRSVLANDVFLLSHELTNRFEKLSHRDLPRGSHGRLALPGPLIDER